MLVRLTSAPIDEDELLRTVLRPDCGAVLTFRGVVRRHHQNRQVTHIDYSAYEEMAERELRRVASETAQLHHLETLALVHRLGTVPVGETSLLVVAGARHRREVFAGVLRLVDEVKRCVPIWKKEYGPDGACWVEGLVPPVA